MTGGARISLLDRGHARLDETVEQRLDRIDEGLVVERNRGLARDRFDHLHVVRLKADDLSVDGGHGQPRLEMALGVDQLHRADDIVGVVAHRNGEH